MTDATAVEAPSFESVSVPKRTGAGRPAAPNPYMDAVKGLGPDSRTAEQALAFVVKAATKEALAEVVSKTRRQLGTAGEKNGVTVGVEVVTAKDGKSAKVTFWTRPRIKRERSEAAPAEASA